jgi:hypothetical protein
MTTTPRHRLLRFLAAALFGLCLTGGAHAELLQWEGTVSLEMAVEPEFIFGGPPEGGGVATLNASAGGDHLTTLGLAGGITGTGFTVPTTSFLPLNAVSWNATLGSGLLAPISGGATGAPLTQNTLPLRGEIRLCVVFMECISFIPIPLTAGGTRGVGIGGLITFNGFGAGGAKASLVAAPWTIGTAVVSTGTTANGGATATFARSGFAHGPASGTTSTARRGGVVQLVTPIQIATSVTGVERLGLIAQLTIVFVPEPGTALLLGAGIATLALHGRERRRRQDRRIPLP